MMISVITPTFNNGEELSDALKSVAKQSEFMSGKVELELILVDDGSDPAHQEKLIELQARIKGVLKLIRLDENQGPAAARNAGIQAATGDWIGFVDSDDLWPEGKLTAIWPYLISDEFDIISGKIRYFSRNGSSLPDLPFEDEANRIHHVHMGALLAKRTLFLEGFWLDESLRFGEDTDWWIRVREEKKSIRLIESETLIYHIHGKNMTSQNQNQSREMLKLLHLSLKRRRQNSDQVEEIPSLKSFAYPQIEVIIPVYNGEKFIQQAIQSVLEQNIPVKKIWVVDDGSSDRTFSILEELQKENSKIEVLHQENQGVSAALNLVLPMIQEEWVAFLDADDLWEPDRIQSQVEYLQKNPSCSLVFGQIEEFEDFSGDQFRQFKAREGAMDGLNRSTLLCKKELFNIFGGFDQSLKVGEFIAWFQKVRESGQEYHVIPKILVKRRVHGENMTAKIDRKDFLHLLRRQITQKRNG
jgi:glycosyltransferase involved in cell wall biosynthesis